MSLMKSVWSKRVITIFYAKYGSALKIKNTWMFSLVERGLGGKAYVEVLVQRVQKDICIIISYVEN
ncbi:hypothetical protein BpHYR1_026932 [Brachionus plicatilis]|uniref:Uncharacterized protein n=1 Tax=Brachionus plicatilis TaxID=10195 RepID=A0A3M7PG53_BRAPC|nr:hypothetical protein BpHYR1_026932 [Brachionus plicatilis]